MATWYNLFLPFLLCVCFNIGNANEKIKRQLENLKLHDDLTAGADVDTWIEGPEEKLYHLRFGRQNWLTAREYCLARGADLVSLGSQEKFDWILSRYALNFRQVKEREVQLGLLMNENGVQGWRWVDGSALNYTFINWMEGEPNDQFGGKERCAVLLVRAKSLIDVDCEKTADQNNIYRFVCEKVNDVEDDETFDHPFWKLLEETARRLGLMKNIKQVNDSYLKERVSKYEEFKQNEILTIENTSTNNVQGLEISPLIMNELLENYNISFVDPIQNAMLEIKESPDNATISTFLNTHGHSTENRTIDQSRILKTGSDLLEYMLKEMKLNLSISQYNTTETSMEQAMVVLKEVIISIQELNQTSKENIYEHIAEMNSNLIALNETKMTVVMEVLQNLLNETPEKLIEMVEKLENITTPVNKEQEISSDQVTQSQETVIYDRKDVTQEIPISYLETTAVTKKLEESAEIHMIPIDTNSSEVLETTTKTSKIEENSKLEVTEEPNVAKDINNNSNEIGNSTKAKYSSKIQISNEIANDEGLKATSPSVALNENLETFPSSQERKGRVQAKRPNIQNRKSTEANQNFTESIEFLGRNASENFKRTKENVTDVLQKLNQSTKKAVDETKMSIFETFEAGKKYGEEKFGQFLTGLGKLFGQDQESTNNSTGNNIQSDSIEEISGNTSYTFVTKSTIKIPEKVVEEPLSTMADITTELENEITKDLEKALETNELEENIKKLEVATNRPETTETENLSINSTASSSSEKLETYLAPESINFTEGSISGRQETPIYPLSSEISNSTSSELETAFTSSISVTLAALEFNSTFESTPQPPTQKNFVQELTTPILIEPDNKKSNKSIQEDRFTLTSFENGTNANDFGENTSNIATEEIQSDSKNVPADKLPMFPILEENENKTEFSSTSSNLFEVSSTLESSTRTIPETTASTNFSSKESTENEKGIQPLQNSSANLTKSEEEGYIYSVIVDFSEIKNKRLRTAKLLEKETRTRRKAKIIKKLKEMFGDMPKDEVKKEMKRIFYQELEKDKQEAKQQQISLMNEQMVPEKVSLPKKAINLESLQKFMDYLDYL